MKKCVFIHTNERQLLGALVSEYSLRRNSRQPDQFDIRILHTRDFPYLYEQEGKSFLRGGTQRVWRMDDLQSFTPLRFQPPQQMQWQGRAVLMDPDIFAVGDINELLNRDMRGAAVMGRHRSDKPGKAQRVATSVMLLDCSRLQHWKPEAEFQQLFSAERDYKQWMVLAHEDPALIGWLEPCWNDFDHLDEHTRLLHNTKRRTQPWKTGLRVDFTPADKFRKRPLLASVNRLRARVFGEYGLLGRYAQHPDLRQQHLFFGLLRECLESGHVSEALVREEIERQHVRADALEVVDRTPELAHRDLNTEPSSIS
ncbi:MAG: hypothetical protein O7F73_08295 [Gammaproteobacteria bacterium]|nr:hypothetical protein [Gammaproteobacteria bacterium]